MKPSVFQVAVLASGSKGNSTLVRCSAGNFLVDMGISCRRVKTSLKDLQLRLEDLTAVFVTHEHIDHVRGLATFLKQYDVPVYASGGTWRGMQATCRSDFSDQPARHILTPGDSVVFPGLRVESFPTSHDALQPSGYVFHLGDHRFGYLTDTGYVSDQARRALDGAEVLVLETNHDMFMLKNGPYPMALKKRILSAKGHLANDAAARFLASLEQLPQEVFLAHLSQENNTPQVALATVEGLVRQQRPAAEIQFFVTGQETVTRNEEWRMTYETSLF
jgi:phosphoribosyl 1,2-cyclic phosphodiesterase